LCDCALIFSKSEVGSSFIFSPPLIFSTITCFIKTEGTHPFPAGERCAGCLRWPCVKHVTNHAYLINVFCIAFFLLMAIITPTATAKTSVARIPNSGITSVPIISIFSVPAATGITNVLEDLVVSVSSKSTSTLSTNTMNSSSPPLVLQSIRFLGNVIFNSPLSVTLVFVNMTILVTSSSTSMLPILPFVNSVSTNITCPLCSTFTVSSVMVGGVVVVVVGVGFFLNYFWWIFRNLSRNRRFYFYSVFQSITTT